MAKAIENKRKIRKHFSSFNNFVFSSTRSAHRNRNDADAMSSIDGLANERRCTFTYTRSEATTTKRIYRRRHASGLRFVSSFILFFPLFFFYSCLQPFSSSSSYFTTTTKRWTCIGTWTVCFGSFVMCVFSFSFFRQWFLSRLRSHSNRLKNIKKKKTLSLCCARARARVLIERKIWMKIKRQRWRRRRRHRFDRFEWRRRQRTKKRKRRKNTQRSISCNKKDNNKCNAQDNGRSNRLKECTRSKASFAPVSIFLFCRLNEDEDREWSK